MNKERYLYSILRSLTFGFSVTFMFFLKGAFSRYDYQRTAAPSSIKSFKAVLPAAASDVYYRDEIGNISTSNLWSQEDSVELELRPRFPLFGGWQTRFYMGYNVPSYEYLYNLGKWLSNFFIYMIVQYLFENSCTVPGTKVVK